MSANRLRLAAAGAALAVTAPLVGAATTAVADEATPDSLPVRTAAGEQQRTITIRGVEPRDDVFFAKGRVRPGYKGRLAIMQRKRRSASKWRDWSTFRTTDESRYRERVAPLGKKGVVCYRVKIRGNKNFETAFSSGRVCIRTS